MKFKSDIEVQAGLKDSSGSNGSSGQVLSSDGTTVSWVNAGGGVASDVQNLVKAGVAINKGQAVYVTGADGTNIIVGLASNTSEATSSKTLGLLDATVAINGMANVVQIGRLEGLNTLEANAGDPVWLGANGNLIYGLANKPYAPLHLVFIGIVTRVNANNGEIFINVQNGFELNEIHDVDLKTDVPINGDVLGYDGTLWVNKTIAEWLGYTPVPNTRALTINGNTQNLTADRTWTIDIGINGSGTVNTLSKFTGATTIGDSQIKDSGTSVSIGYTTNPNTYKLDVNGDVNINTDLYVSGTFPYTIKAAGGVNVDDALGVYWKTDVGGIGGTLAGIGQSSSGLDFYTDSSFLAPKLRILANGNVTIGTLAGSGSRMVVADVTGVLSTQAIPPSGVTSFNTRTGAITLTSGDVTTALGYTPVTDARTITINGVTQDLSTNRSWTVTVVETDTLQTVTNRGATTSILSTFSGGISVDGLSYVTNNGYFRSGTQGFRWNDSSGNYNNVIMRDNGTTWFRNYIETPDSARAPIFYDYNNTAYYGDFASTSNFNKLLLNSENSFNTTTPGLTSYGLTLMGGTSDYANGVVWTWGNTNAQAGIYVQSSGSYGTKMYFATTDSFATGSKTGMSMDHNGTVLVTRSYLQSDSSLRAPIFYDSNNTGYYLDASSTGTSLNMAGSVNAATYNKPGLLVNASGTASTGAAFAIQQVTSEGWTGIFVDFEPNTGWGLYHDNPSNYFLITAETTDGNIGSNVVPSRSSGNRTAYTKFQFQQTDGVGIAGGSWRAPVFYDYNNTGYYIDGASTSRLNTLTLSALASDDGMIENNTGGYFHLGGWGVARTAPTAILVNTAYRSDFADDAVVSNYSRMDYLMSDRDFPNGTLIQTSINYNNSEGDPFVLEIKGNSYGNGMPMDIQIQGYIYANTIINTGGYSNGFQVSSISAIRYGGNLCFWFPSQGYWNGYTVKVYTAYSGRQANKVTSITNSGLPTTDKIVNFTTAQSLRSDNYRGYSNFLTSVYGPTYYDSDDTAYYANFASTSDLAVKQRGGTIHGPNVTWGAYLLVGGDGRQNYTDTTVASVCTTNGNLHLDSGSGYSTHINFYDGNDIIFGNGANTEIGRVYNAGYLQMSGSVRAALFYDSNNTGYYLDPASTSNLYDLIIAGQSNKYLFINPGNGYEAMVRYNGGSGSSWYSGKRTANTTQAGTDGFHFYSDAAGDTVVGFGADGTIRGKGDVVAYSSSDRQLKDNIKPIENALEKVKQIGGYTFDWNNKQTIYEGHDVGIIAQEIEAVLPEVVTTRDTGFKAVKYEKIVPLLIEAIKEQQTQIEELKELVNKLINK